MKDIDALLNLDNKGMLKIVTGKEAVKEAIRNMIYIQMGEVIMDPAIGSIFQSLIHEPMIETTSFLMRNILRNTLKTYLSDVPVANIKVTIRIDPFREAFLVEVSFYYDENQEALTEIFEV